MSPISLLLVISVRDVVDHSRGGRGTGTGSADARRTENVRLLALKISGKCRVGFAGRLVMRIFDSSQSHHNGYLPIPRYGPKHHNREIVGVPNRKHAIAPTKLPFGIRQSPHQGDDIMQVCSRPYNQSRSLKRPSFVRQGAMGACLLSVGFS